MVARLPLKRRRIMKDFVIRELSAVDLPAQKHAVAVLMKRDDKIARMKESLAQFLAAVQAESAEIAETITKALTAAPAIAGLLPEVSKGDDPMTDAEKKQLAGLQKAVDDLTAQLAAATSTDPAKKAAEAQAAVAATAAELDAVKADLAKAAARAEAAEAVAKMSADERDYMADMDDKTRKEFMGLSPEDRRKKMKKAADDNPVVYKSERTSQEFRKNDDPRIIAMAKDADAQAKRADEEVEKREAAELAKRADEAPYSAFDVEKAADGTPKDGTSKVDVLREIAKMADGPRAILEKWLSVGGKAVGAAFETLGHSREQTQKSAADFEKRVAEVEARDKIGRLAALEKAQREFPAEFAAYQATGAQIN
jgi:hypothetical protein